MFIQIKKIRELVSKYYRFINILTISSINFLISFSYLFIFNKIERGSLFSNISYVISIITFAVALSSFSLSTQMIIEKEKKYLKNIFISILKLNIFVFILISPIVILFLRPVIEISLFNIILIFLYSFGLIYFQTFTTYILRLSNIKIYRKYNYRVLSIVILTIAVLYIISIFIILDSIIIRFLPFILAYIIFVKKKYLYNFFQNTSDLFQFVIKHSQYITFFIPNIIFGFFLSNYDRVYIINNKISDPNKYFYIITLLSTTFIVYDSYYKSLLNKIRDISFLNFTFKTSLISIALFIPYFICYKLILFSLSANDFFSFEIFSILFFNYFIQGIFQFFNNYFVRENMNYIIVGSNIFFGILAIIGINYLANGNYDNIAIILVFCNLLQLLSFLICYKISWIYQS
jgi:hypothetical protein